MVYPALLPLMRTPRLPVVDWTDVPADLNRLVHFAERRNLVSARVPSHFKRNLQGQSVCSSIVDFAIQRPVSKQDCEVNAGFCNYAILSCGMELESVRWAGVTDVGCWQFLGILLRSNKRIPDPLVRIHWSVQAVFDLVSTTNLFCRIFVKFCMRASWKSAQLQLCFTSRRKWISNRFPHFLTYWDNFQYVLRLFFLSNTRIPGVENISISPPVFLWPCVYDEIFFVVFLWNSTCELHENRQVVFLLYLKALMIFQPFSSFFWRI